MVRSVKSNKSKEGYLCYKRADVVEAETEAAVVQVNRSLMYEMSGSNV